MAVRYGLPYNKLLQPLSAPSLVQSANQRAVLLAATHWAGDSGWGQSDSEAVCVADSLIPGVVQPSCVADRPLVHTAVTCGSVPLHSGVLN
jgi:hypothetical protein